MADASEPYSSSQGHAPTTTPAPDAPNEAAHPVQHRDMFGASGFGDTSGFGGLAVIEPELGSTPRPYGGWFDEAADALAEAYPGANDAIERAVVHAGELTLFVKREKLLDMLAVLRNSPQLRFETLAAVSGADYPSDPTGRRLHSVYHLLSMTHRRRLRLEVSVTAEDPHVPSACELYPTANWHERESWDLMGIVYDGHPALTRIEMPDDWPGHPQRKDYPLGGIPVEYKGAEIPPPDHRRSYS